MVVFYDINLPTKLVFKCKGIGLIYDLKHNRFTNEFNSVSYAVLTRGKKLTIIKASAVTTYVPYYIIKI